MLKTISGTASMTWLKALTSRWSRTVACAGLFGLLAVGGVHSQSPPATVQTTAVAPSSQTTSPLDEPIRLINEARKSFQGVRDYSALFVKRERIGGQMQPESQIAMKVRNQPFSIHMRWLSPKAQVGQEACYVAGKNKGNMRVRSPGLLGAVGWVSIDPKDPRAQQTSRHSITEAGIGNLIERFALRWEEEKKMGLTQVKVGEFEFNKRRCSRVEIIHPQNRTDIFQTYRNVLFFDKESNMPIRIEVYDWPKQGGSADGELLEMYNYVNLRLNVGLGDDSFNY